MKFKLTLSPTECSIESDASVQIHRIERKNGNWSVELLGEPPVNTWSLGPSQPAFTEVKPKVLVDGTAVLMQTSLDDDTAEVVAFFAESSDGQSSNTTALEYIGQDRDTHSIVSATAEVTWRS